MKALVTRLKSLALRPLWTETEARKSRRRGQLLLSMPFVLLAGLTWGWFSAPAIGQGSGLLWSVLGATGFGLFFYLEQQLVPLVATVAERIGLGGLAVLAWEIGVVGGLIFLFTSVLGAPVVPAVALAIGVGAIYSLGMEYLIFGSAADHMMNLLGMGRGWSGARGSDYSHAEALAKRGDLVSAAAIYKEAIWTKRRDPLPYFRLASIRTRMGVPEEAIEVLRTALEAARLSTEEEGLIIRKIHEIFATQLGDPARAAPELARYLEREPEGPHGEWARRELAHIKDSLREDADTPSTGSGSTPSPGG